MPPFAEFVGRTKLGHSVMGFPHHADARSMVVVFRTEDKVVVIAKPPGKTHHTIFLNSKRLRTHIAFGQDIALVRYAKSLKIKTGRTVVVDLDKVLSVDRFTVEGITFTLLGADFFRNREYVVREFEKWSRDALRSWRGVIKVPFDKFEIGFHKISDTPEQGLNNANRVSLSTGSIIAFEPKEWISIYLHELSHSVRDYMSKTDPSKDDGGHDLAFSGYLSKIDPIRAKEWSTTVYSNRADQENKNRIKANPSYDPSKGYLRVYNKYNAAWRPMRGETWPAVYINLDDYPLYDLLRRMLPSDIRRAIVKQYRNKPTTLYEFADRVAKENDFEMVKRVLRRK